MIGHATNHGSADAGQGPPRPTTAVIQIADDGTPTLYLGTELVEHAAGVDRTVVICVLVDYAATIDNGIRVTTQMPDGTWTRHHLEPDGTLTPAATERARQTNGASPDGNAGSPRSRPQGVWTRIRTKATSHGWLLALLLLLIATLVAVLATA